MAHPAQLRLIQRFDQLGGGVLHLHLVQQLVDLLLTVLVAGPGQSLQQGYDRAGITTFLHVSDGGQHLGVVVAQKRGKGVVQQVLFLSGHGPAKVGGCVKVSIGAAQLQLFQDPLDRVLQFATAPDGIAQQFRARGEGALAQRIHQRTQAFATVSCSDPPLHLCVDPGDQFLVHPAVTQLGLQHQHGPVEAA